MTGTEGDGEGARDDDSELRMWTGTGTGRVCNLYVPAAQEPPSYFFTPMGESSRAGDGRQAQQAMAGGPGRGRSVRARITLTARQRNFESSRVSARRCKGAEGGVEGGATWRGGARSQAEER